jgi:hypothetical protein
MSSAELSLWARVDGLERGEVEHAIWQERRLVKMWAMRGTLHLLPAAEWRLWQAGLASFRHFLTPAWLRYFEVTEHELERMIAAIDEVLRNRMLTREELAEAVSGLTGSAELGGKLRQSWGSLLKPACYRGHLCFAPGVGQKVRFTTPRTWLPRKRRVPSKAAMPEIARRYLGAYGPATREDLSRWWGMSAPAAAALLAEAGAVPVDLDGTRAFLLREHVSEALEARSPRTVRLLPAFDPYVIAASPHARQLMPGDYRSRIWRPQGWLSPVLLVDGRLEGVWEWERKGRRLLVTLNPFGKIPGWAAKAAEFEAERLSRFLDAALDLKWS